MKDMLFDVPATEAPAAPELPPIVGTEKQVPWANAVRKKKLADIREFLDRTQVYIDWMRLTNAEKADALQVEHSEITARYEQLCAETSASFWLARRDNSARELLDNATPKPGATNWHTTREEA